MIQPFENEYQNEDAIETFLEIASEEQMYVIFRPGPYICAEWEWGGYPAWLLEKNITLRTTWSPEYLDLVEIWMTRVFQKIKRFQYSYGGNIIAFQVENEYGSYQACDFAYTSHMRDLM